MKGNTDKISTPPPAGAGSKMYVGVRERGYARIYVETPEGQRYSLRHVVRHSPTGLEFGYGGSGPADLALSILTDAVGAELANAYYQDFKWAFVAGWPRDGFCLFEKAIRDWLTAQGVSLPCVKTA